MGAMDEYAIERVARLMCEELGLDPDDLVYISYGDDLTPVERSGVGFDDRYNQSPAETMQITIHGMLYRVPVCTNPANPQQSVQRWRKYRPQAAIALASWKAVHTYTMTET